VIETISPASLIKQVNYQMTGRYTLPETDEEIKAIIDGNPDIFGQIIPDNTHMLISVNMAGSASDKDRKISLLQLKMLYLLRISRPLTILLSLAIQHSAFP
jgi:predicted RND superfamily exporter protein